MTIPFNATVPSYVTNDKGTDARTLWARAEVRARDLLPLDHAFFGGGWREVLSIFRNVDELEDVYGNHDEFGPEERELRLAAQKLDTVHEGWVVVRYFDLAHTSPDTVKDALKVFAADDLIEVQVPFATQEGPAK